MAPGSGTTPGACELPEPTISGRSAAATVPDVNEAAFKPVNPAPLPEGVK